MVTFEDTYPLNCVSYKIAQHRADLYLQARPFLRRCCSQLCNSRRLACSASQRQIMAKKKPGNDAWAINTTSHVQVPFPSSRRRQCWKAWTYHGLQRMERLRVRTISHLTLLIVCACGCQVLGLGTDIGDVAPSVLLFFDKQRLGSTEPQTHVHSIIVIPCPVVHYWGTLSDILWTSCTALSLNVACMHAGTYSMPARVSSALLCSTRSS